MWPVEQMKEEGIRCAPEENSFTYTFPPPYFTKSRGALRIPHTYANGSLTTSVSLYLHIPFCETDCTFCSLHRTAIHDADTITRYLRALRRELHALSKQNIRAQLDSVYIGGGTPTICSAVELGELLDSVSGSFQLPDSPIEVSLECAPSPKRTFQQWKAYLNILASRKTLAVNRVSFGVQSDDSATLRHMGRAGGELAALALLRAADETCASYNADFLLNYPTVPSAIAQPDWIRSLLSWVDGVRATGLRLPSLSIYQLWDVDSIAIGRARQVQFLGEEQLLDRKWSLQEGLFSRQYSPVIISTVAQSDEHASQCFKNRHLSFCHIGCGSGAYSIFPLEVVQRPRNILQYMLACERGDVLESSSCCYRLTPEEVEIRRLIMGLRSYEWIPVTGSMGKLHVLTRSLQETQERIEILVGLGLVDKNNNMYRLTNTAFLIANELSTYLHPASHSRTGAIHGS